MAITVLRQPKYNFGPAGQDWLYSVTSSNVTQPKFKFIFDIRFHISTVPGPLDVRLRVSPGAVNIGNVNTLLTTSNEAVLTLFCCTVIFSVAISFASCDF